MARRKTRLSYSQRKARKEAWQIAGVVVGALVAFPTVVPFFAIMLAGEAGFNSPLAHAYFSAIRNLF